MIVTQEEKKELIGAINSQIVICNKCSLCSTRTNAVPGEGPTSAKIMIIGEAPGETEDQNGKPFCGKAGGLLDQILEQITLSRDKIYITNIVKCRPPKNRDPEENELKQCTSYLEQQINIIKPKIIITLGRFSSQWILKTEEKITPLTNKYFIKEDMDYKYSVIPMFHPSYLLRNRQMVKPSAEGLKERIKKSIEELKSIK